MKHPERVASDAGDEEIMELDTITCMDALQFAQSLPDESVNSVITSPPYFGLRNYNVEGQIGLEQTPLEYVQKLVCLFREIRRALKADGTVWLNLGDTYTGGGRGGNPPLSAYWKQSTNAGSMIGMRTDVEGLQSKNLLMIPARVAIALQDDGWIIRSEIVWHKPNPMPESVTDRPTRAHEMIYMLTKNPHYWYDIDAIREPHIGAKTDKRADGKRHLSKGKTATGNYATDAVMYHPDGRNKRDVWIIPTHGTPEAHFATFPEKLIEPMILAGCPPFGVVYDPFMGSGTTALVARRFGRHYVGSELNPDYVAIAEKRLSAPYMQDMFEVLS